MRLSRAWARTLADNNNVGCRQLATVTRWRAQRECSFAHVLWHRSWTKAARRAQDTCLACVRLGRTLPQAYGLFVLRALCASIVATPKHTTAPAANRRGTKKGTGNISGALVSSHQVQRTNQAPGMDTTAAEDQYMEGWLVAPVKSSAAMIRSRTEPRA